MAAGIQRPLRGSRISTFYPIKTLPSLSSLDSAFQLQEYISLLIRLDIHDVEAITSLPGSKESKEGGGEAQDGEKQVTVDEACWVYEQLRRLAQDMTHPLVTTLQQECTRSTCPEMKAGEWLYLCVAHGNEGSMEQCCAIDYILHTLDCATALLSSPRAFPSRLQIPATSHRHFSALARRLGRIFAHAYFHHREAFEQAEVESSLYARFLALSSKFELVPQEFLPIPPEAFAHHHGEEDEDVEPPRLHAAGLDHPSTSTSSSGPSSIAQHPQRDEYTRDSHLTLLVPSAESQSGVSPPGLQAEHSPRRVGRNRTDTMVPSEASSIMEELAARSAEHDAQDVVSKEEEPIPSSSTGEAESEGHKAEDAASSNDDEPSHPEPSTDDAPPVPEEEQITTGSAPDATTATETEAETEISFSTEPEHESSQEEEDVVALSADNSEDSKGGEEDAAGVFGVTTAAPLSETPGDSEAPAEASGVEDGGEVKVDAAEAEVDEAKGGEEEKKAGEAEKEKEESGDSDES